MPTVLSDAFSLEFESISRILVGRWRHDVADTSLHPPHQELVAAARHYNCCRFWLFDMRAQDEYSPALLRWLKTLLTEQVGIELGSPVFVACVASEVHRHAIESIGTETLLRQHAWHEFYPYFFDNEPDARDWLIGCQDHEHRPPRR
ncbi:hypothetical protein [Hymenobacter terricola]|uniref:hypothetical protein n=1 Tax=Hymenobacter terricola TaxID=2819236 RepID=UPI001B313F7A|nr:hypothetical protein [Hymenobacter terricola]